MKNTFLLLVAGSVIGFAVGEWLAIETFIHRNTQLLIREIEEYHEYYSAD